MVELSVIIPAYNAESTITRAVRSVLRDVPEGSEVLVLDDGSTDATATRVRRIHHPALRLLQQPNAGVAASLNRLLGEASSDTIARMDADDVSLPGRFHAQYRALRDADMVFTTVLPLRNGIPRPTAPRSVSANAFPYALLLTNPVAHSTLMARRTALTDIGGYRPLPTEDYDLWLRAAANGAKMRRLALPRVLYREHGAQVTASPTWRMSSWQDPNIADAFATLSERLIGIPAPRITSLTIDASRSLSAKRADFTRFADAFRDAITTLSERDRTWLEAKLLDRAVWFDRQLATRRAGAA